MFLKNLSIDKIFIDCEIDVLKIYDSNFDFNFPSKRRMSLDIENCIVRSAIYWHECVQVSLMIEQLLLHTSSFHRRREQQSNKFELRLRTIDPEGIIAWVGRGKVEHLVLSLHGGHVVLTYKSKNEQISIKSRVSIIVWIWHRSFLSFFIKYFSLSPFCHNVDDSFTRYLCRIIK